VNRTFRKWLPSAFLGFASVAAFGVIVAGPAGTAHAADAPAPTPAGIAPGIPAPGATGGMTHHETRLQPNYFYCAPAATRIALSTHAEAVSMDQLAGELGTTTNGTDSAFDVTRVMNAHFGAGRYKTVEIPGVSATPEQAAALQKDVVAAVNRGDAVVANVAGYVTDTAGDFHSYPGGHYLTVVGYVDNGSVVRIADPADTVGTPEYDLNVGTLANWIGTRGYSA
jgi:Peptidase_C39 like family